MELATLLLVVTVLLVLLSQPKSTNLPKVSPKKKLVVMDTSAIIDGRVQGIVKTGFMNPNLVIPQFVVAELQMLADGNDSHKRERARFGLDVVQELQDSRHVDVEIDRSFFSEEGEVDDKLVKLCKKRQAQLYTTDFNLQKVAEIEGIFVLNVNQLAQDLRPTILPGERVSIKILQRGSNKNQGVGYLDDGTMIVVDGAAKRINKLVEVVVNRSLQTVAGKMVFGEVVDNKPPQAPKSDTKKPAPKVKQVRNRRPQS